MVRDTSGPTPGVPRAVEFSLTGGGPFWRLLSSLGLRRGDDRDPARISLFLVGVAWIPFVGSEVFQWLVWKDADPPFRLVSSHVRLLLAIPIFVAAERILEVRGRNAILRFSGGEMVEPDQSGALLHELRAAERHRDSALAEGVMLGLAILSGQISYWEGSTGAVGGSAFSGGWLGRIWYGYVGLPIFVFLLLRMLWRWGIWSLLLGRLSRLRLWLVPTFPARSGGLGCLTEPIAGFALVVLGASTVIAASWSDRIRLEGASFQAFGPGFLTLILVSELLALGPLLFFVGPLVRTRLQGLEEYDRLALTYTRRFHHRWIRVRGSAHLLGTSDIQSLSDLVNSYSVVLGMRVVPFDKRPALLVLVACLLPMLALAAEQAQLQVILLRLMKEMI